MTDYVRLHTPTLPGGPLAPQGRVHLAFRDEDAFQFADSSACMAALSSFRVEPFDYVVGLFHGTIYTQHPVTRSHGSGEGQEQRSRTVEQDSGGVHNSDDDGA